jgi:hypothetical protein
VLKPGEFSGYSSQPCKQLFIEPIDAGRPVRSRSTLAIGMNVDLLKKFRKPQRGFLIMDKQE